MVEKGALLTVSIATLSTAVGLTRGAHHEELEWKFRRPCVVSAGDVLLGRSGCCPLTDNRDQEEGNKALDIPWLKGIIPPLGEIQTSINGGGGGGEGIAL
jgi:hypothetical protein